MLLIKIQLAISLELRPHLSFRKCLILEEKKKLLARWQIEEPRFLL
jgi:hypothetical protein